MTGNRVLMNLSPYRGVTSPLRARSAQPGPGSQEEFQEEELVVGPVSYYIPETHLISPAKVLNFFALSLIIAGPGLGELCDLKAF